MPNSLPGVNVKVLITDPNGESFDGYLLLVYKDDHLFLLDRIFIHAAKTGSTLHGLMRTLEAAVNSSIQQGGDSLRELLREWHGLEYSPKGETNDPEIPVVKSLAHYISRRIMLGAPGTSPNLKGASNGHRNAV